MLGMREKFIYVFCCFKQAQNQPSSWLNKYDASNSVKQNIEKSSTSLLWWRQSIHTKSWLKLFYINFKIEFQPLIQIKSILIFLFFIHSEAVKQSSYGNKLDSLVWCANASSFGSSEYGVSSISHIWHTNEFARLHHILAGWSFINIVLLSWNFSNNKVSLYNYSYVFLIKNILCFQIAGTIYCRIISTLYIAHYIIYFRAAECGGWGAGYEWTGICNEFM